MEKVLNIAILIMCVILIIKTVWQMAKNMNKHIGNPFKTNLFQLVDTGGEEVMLVHTILEFSVVREEFKKFYNGDWDYPEQFIEQMQKKGLDIKRVFVDEIINP